jgi:hypothetical protein
MTADIFVEVGNIPIDAVLLCIVTVNIVVGSIIRASCEATWSDDYVCKRVVSVDDTANT